MQNTVLWGGFRVWQRHRDAFLRSWRVEVGGIAVEPFLMLIALGFGLGVYVESFDGLTYAQFVVPGVLASYAMFHATFDSTYGAYLRMDTHHIYEAILFTPLGPEDIVLGEVLWGATRAAMTGVAVLMAALVFTLVESPLAVLSIPAAFLIGVAFASLAMVLTAAAKSIGTMNNFFTLFLTPMFLFSGVFFPLDRLPEGVQVLVCVLPLTPAVALVRGLVTGEISWLIGVWVLQLLGFSFVAFWVAARLMRRRLMK